MVFLSSRERSHAVPDLSIHGSLSSVHCSLDLSKYNLIRGLLENNLGEPVEEFIRPYDLQDPRIHVRVVDLVAGTYLFEASLYPAIPEGI